VLAIGVVVDDAIVVLENMYRHVEEGMPPMKAAFKAMEEISFAIIAITLALVAVFLPLAFQQSQTGRLFVEFAVAVCGSVVISAFVALTLSPMMASRLLKPIHAQKHGALFRFFERVLNGMTNAYTACLRWCLAHRITMLAVTVATFVLMVVSYRALDQDFLPEEDKGRLFCFMFTPNGSTSEFTDRQLHKLEKIITTVPEVDTYAAMVAPGFNGPGQATVGILFVTFKELGERKRSVQEIVNGPGGLRGRFFAEVEGAIAVPNIPKAIGRGQGAPFELILQNQDLAALNTTANDIANQLRGMTNLQNVRVSFEVNKPELRIQVDRQRAAALGVSIEDISRTLQILFGGLDLSRLKVAGKEYLVMAQLERESRLTPQDLDKIFVRNASGGLIQLSSLVIRTTGAAPNAINHYSRLRSASITASPVGVPIGTVVEQTEQMLKTALPGGFLYTWGGEARDLRDASSEVFWILGLAIIIVYMTLAAQFESLIHPLTVMLALPLAMVGAFGLLWGLGWLGKI
ncbi:MAG TPA: efflux RND transporter permease subunit, partial [Verrucomicrobiae bacterium]|nr:efflux RND transporter permease subunit [Verrucomicrobiae bacterium]